MSFQTHSFGSPGSHMGGGGNHDHIFFRHFRHKHGEGYIQLSPFSGGIDYEVSVSGHSRISNIRLRHRSGHEIAVLTPIKRFHSDSFYDIGTIGPDLIESPYSIYDLLSLLMGRMGYVVIQTDDGEILVNASLEDYFPDDFIFRIKPIVVVIRHSCHVEDEDDDFDRKHHCETHERIHHDFISQHIDIKQVNITNVTQVVQHITNITKAPPPASTGTGSKPDSGKPTTGTGGAILPKPGTTKPPVTTTATPSPSSITPTGPAPAPIVPPATIDTKASKTTDKSIIDTLTNPVGNKHKDVLGPDNKDTKPLSRKTPKINCKKDPTDPTCGANEAPKSTAGDTPHTPLTNDSTSATKTAALAIIDNHPTATFLIGGVIVFAALLWFANRHKGFKLGFLSKRKGRKR